MTILLIVTYFGNNGLLFDFKHTFSKHLLFDDDGDDKIYILNLFIGRISGKS